MLFCALEQHACRVDQRVQKLVGKLALLQDGKTKAFDKLLKLLFLQVREVFCRLSAHFSAPLHSTSECIVWDANLSKDLVDAERLGFLDDGRPVGCGPRPSANQQRTARACDARRLRGGLLGALR